MTRGLALALILLAVPATADAACEKSKGQPLNADSDLTLEYLSCRHREQVEALQRWRQTRTPPQDPSQIPDGALDELGRRVDPFAGTAQRTQQSLDVMDNVNREMGDRLRMLQPRRLP